MEMKKGNHYFHPIHSTNLTGARYVEYVSSINVNLSPNIQKGIGVDTILRDVSENLAFQLKNFITEKGWDGSHISVVVTVGIVPDEHAHKHMSRHQNEYTERDQENLSLDIQQG